MNLREYDLTNLPAMMQERSSHASVFSEGIIFVAGGVKRRARTGTTFLSSMEKYANKFPANLYIMFFSSIDFLASLIFLCDNIDTTSKVIVGKHVRQCQHAGHSFASSLPTILFMLLADGMKVRHWRLSNGITSIQTCGRQYDQ